MLQKPVAFYDASLMNTSSWANFFLERDHSAVRASEGENTEQKSPDLPPTEQAVSADKKTISPQQKTGE